MTQRNLKSPGEPPASNAGLAANIQGGIFYTSVGFFLTRTTGATFEKINDIVEDLQRRKTPKLDTLDFLFVF